MANSYPSIPSHGIDPRVVATHRTTHERRVLFSVDATELRLSDDGENWRFEYQPHDGATAAPAAPTGAGQTHGAPLPSGSIADRAPIQSSPPKRSS
jgi:hypothetical protein